VVLRGQLGCAIVGQDFPPAFPQERASLVPPPVRRADVVLADVALIAQHDQAGGVYRFKISRTLSDLWIHKISYAAR
jgi:hypothetical protein